MLNDYFIVYHVTVPCGMYMYYCCICQSSIDWGQKETWNFIDSKGESKESLEHLTIVNRMIIKVSIFKGIKEGRNENGSNCFVY